MWKNNIKWLFHEHFKPLYSVKYTGDRLSNV